ncbi:hypothetical protein KC19_11G143700 [Ceratodon purpureus]|uniref:Uncharacterized protein n=1 Tax=Ceratodon purpureus TaxID=3225 RepID=A0A8T0GEC6_CERPU|nr:hypothetical protein KC19_11G143700 [Ceratodon purpureus]
MFLPLIIFTVSKVLGFQKCYHLIEAMIRFSRIQQANRDSHPSGLQFTAQASMLCMPG